MNKDAAWYYPATKQAAKIIEGRVAFWKGVVVESRMMQQSQLLFVTDEIRI